MKPTAEERAKVAAGWCEAMCSGELRPCSKCVAIAIGEAYADGRRAGLEEAAQLASRKAYETQDEADDLDEEGDVEEMEIMEGLAQEMRWAAGAIRALADKEPT